MQLIKPGLAVGLLAGGAALTGTTALAGTTDINLQRQIKPNNPIVVNNIAGKVTVHATHRNNVQITGELGQRLDRA